MADSSVFSDRLLRQQKAMFRQAALAGFSQERIRAETDLPTTSLSDWALGKAKLSLLGYIRIAAVEDFPPGLLSLIFDGTGRHIADDSTDDGDHAAVADNCVDFTGKYTRARHPLSEAGTDIGPTEDKELRQCGRQLRVKAA